MSSLCALSCLLSVKKQKHDSVQCIIKQLLDSVFGILFASNALYEVCARYIHCLFSIYHMIFVCVVFILC